MRKIKFNVEIIAKYLTVVGVISAIIFSGYQAYYLRREFILNMRPYIKIDSKPLETETSVLGIIVKRDNYFLSYSFEKNKYEKLVIPIEVTNVGKTPAFIKEAVISIRSGMSNHEFFKVNVIKNETNREFVVFPNESVYIGLESTRTPDMQYSTNYQGKDLKISFPLDSFNKICAEVQKCLKTENFICEVIVKYGFLSETRCHKDYTARKVWVIKPGGKEMSTYHYSTT